MDNRFDDLIYSIYFLANGNYANNNNAQTATVDMNANTEKSTLLAAGQSSATSTATTAATTNNSNNNTQSQSGNVNNNLNGQQPKAQRNTRTGGGKPNRGSSSKSNQVSDTVKNEKLVNGSS